MDIQTMASLEEFISMICHFRKVSRKEAVDIVADGKLADKDLEDLHRYFDD